MNEVWITGVGCISALGRTFDCHRRAAAHAIGGITEVAFREFFFSPDSDKPGGGKVFRQPCGMVPADLVGDLEQTAPDRATQLLRSALQEATGMADIKPGTKADMILGTTLGNMHGSSRYYHDYTMGKQPDKGLISQAILHSPSKAVARQAGIEGRVVTISSACASSAIALGRACHHIRSGRSQLVITGGFDALSPFVIAGFRSLRLISDEACRPFDRQRTGLTPGEAAAVLVMESPQSARRRGVKPIAAMAGFGEALEAYHHTRAHPEGTGLASAMNQALREASCGPDQISVVHLHGTATRANDISEYMACRSVFGTHLATLPVCSTKSMTGHTFGAAGALSAVFCLSTILDTVVPATLFLNECDPEFEKLAVSCHPRKVTNVNRVLMTALGFGGEAASCIFRGVDNE
ncbi:MAG: beta-ketoacyl synthase N-terminal-like domain-containing protein [Chitinispirillaceae bacterium]